MASAYSTFTDMKVGEVLYEGERFLTQYEVRKVRMESVVNKKASQEIHVEITLGRQLLGVILNVIIPTFVLNIISYSTNFYKETYFETVKPSDSFQLNLDPSLPGDRHQPDHHAGDGHAICQCKSSPSNLATVNIIILIKVNESLPATSYIKMIDAWLIFNLLIPFILIMIHTYMDTLRE